MKNKAFFVQYLTNQPVEIETHFDGELERKRPLNNVSKLIAAIVVEPTRRLAGIPEDYGPLTLHYVVDGPAIAGDVLLKSIQHPVGSYDQPLVIKSKNDYGQSLAHGPTVRLDKFLSNTLEDIEKDLSKISTTGTRRRHSKTPSHVGRWESFSTDAKAYEYPTTHIRSDVVLPVTREIAFTLERDVDRAVGYHLDNFNRIFKDQGKTHRFKAKPTVFPLNSGTPTQTENSIKFIGVPDNVLTLGSKVLSFIEDKTPNDLPVRHFASGNPFDLLEMYKEDIQYQQSKITREDIGRMDVCTVIDQVYGYLSLNNLIYGCVTCYDVTYFLWRPKRSTLLISHPIFNNSHSPTLLQALYYFVQLALRDYKKQTLDPSPKDSDMPVELNASNEMDTDEHNADEQSESGSNYSTTGQGKETNYNPDKSKGTKYNLNLDSLHSGAVVGSGATGQVIRLKDSNIVVKQCDSYNNPEGFKMLKNEISIYEKLSPLNLKYIPRYYGQCEYYGQHFIALDYIPGNHCDWRANSELNEKLNRVIRDLKSVGVVHQDLRPENVLLTHDGDIKLIDFGKAEIK
ncbi:hypothetical protein O5D80_000111 [Batrachochytrium dendrobatidis]|nr:hypothetical protein O5D80_000111 [Batrachochytrium dendrobatidis]